jgi:hypothetical protein
METNTSRRFHQRSVITPLSEPRDSVDEWLTPEELAADLERTVGTLQNWRSQKRGPAYARWGKSVRYRLRDVEAWKRSTLVSTSR